MVGRIDALAADLRLDTAQRSGAEAERLYFALAAGADRVKIGVAVDPSDRVAALQTACPHRIELLGSVPGSRELKRAVHARLGDYHVGGEWFYFATPVRAAIDRFLSTNIRSDAAAFANAFNEAELDDPVGMWAMVLRSGW